MERKRFKLRTMTFLGVALLSFGARSTEIYANEVGRRSFSEEEQRYIEGKKDVRVAVLENWAPLAIRDEKNETYRGLAADILSNFGSETGLKIAYIEADNYLEAIRMAEEGEVDLAAVAVSYPGKGNDYRIVLTDPYLDAQMVVIQSKNIDLGNLTEYEVAEVNGYPRLTDNPAFSHLYFDTLEDCLLAIRAYQADFMYCDIFTGTSYIQKYKNRDLVSFPVNKRALFGFGVHSAEGTVLQELLNGTIARMDNLQINASLNENQRDRTYNFGDFVYYYPFEIICVSLTVTFLIAIVFVSYIRIKSRQSVSLQGYMTSYRMLADTFGEAALSYDYRDDRLKVFGKYGHKLSIPSEIEHFSSYLETAGKEISWTRDQFEQMLRDGMSGKSYDIGLECKLKDGAWEHFRFIFSVIATDEAYGRPVRMVGCLSNVEKEYCEREELLHLGHYDKLTGLYNRGGGELRIRERIETPGAVGKDILLVIDVDYFKKFNDVYGHACGDDVLRSIGSHLRLIFRQKDILCRWGGDEFLLYLVGSAEEADWVKQSCTILQDELREYSYEGKTVPVTLSIGGTIVAEGSLEEVFQAADQALYKVKERGRDAVCIALDGEVISVGQGGAVR